MFAVTLRLPTAALAKMTKGMDDLKEPLRMVGHYVTEEWMPELFKSKGKGTWPARKYRDPGGQPLVEHGLLARGFFADPGDDRKSIRIINIGKPSNVVWALNYGTTIRAKSGKYLVFSFPTTITKTKAGKPRKRPKTGKGWASVKSVTIPPREFMKWWPEMKDEAKRIAREELEKQLEACL